MVKRWKIEPRDVDGMLAEMKDNVNRFSASERGYREATGEAFSPRRCKELAF